MTENSKILKQIELQQAINSKDISTIAQSVETTNQSVAMLAEAIKRDSKEMDARIDNLIRQSDACNLKFVALVEKLDNKKEQLKHHNSRLVVLETLKVDRKEFDRVIDRLWKIGFGLTGAGFAITWALIKYSFVKGGN